MTIINLNLTDYMGPDNIRPEIVAYATLVDVNLRDGRINPALTTRCPECNCDFADLDEAHEDTEHILIATTSDTIAVVVACEGYFMVNPNLVGINAPNWQDWSKPVCVLNTDATLPTQVAADRLWKGIVS